MLIFASSMELKVLPYITQKRLLNLALIAANYLESVCTGQVIHRAKPYAASIEPANYCNLNCPQGPTGNGSIKKTPLCLSIKNFKKIINHLLPELTYLNLYFQGEPFLNNDLAEMIQYAHEERVFTCVSTNGHFLSKEICEQLKKAKLDKLIICLDGATKDTYETYRKGGDFNTVIEGIKNSVKVKLPVEVQCLLLKSNEHEKNDIKRLCKKLGVSKINFKKAQFYDYELMPTKSSDRRYKETEDGKYIPKNAMHNRCQRLWSSVVISSGGEILPCCFDKDASHSFGNIFQDSFSNIWLSNKANAFRLNVLKNRSSIPICINCTE